MTQPVRVVGRVGLVAVLWVAGCRAPSDTPDDLGLDTDVSSVSDADADGVEAAEDCSDDDGTLGAVADDADCDRAITAFDCDDDDPTLGAVADDADCDRAITADDCDDRDPLSAVILADADCDAVLTALDCDDRDLTLGARADDADCDRVLTADDCDNGDPVSTVILADADCDAVLTADDCDDGDPLSTVVASDADCDGVVRASDCDDGNAAVANMDTSPDLGVLRCAPAGTFLMGCVVGRDDVAGGCDADEARPHSVTLTHPFWVMESEVTQAQYLAVLGLRPSFYLGSNHPVEQVSWTEAVEFADAVSVASGLTPCGSGDPYVCDGWRLPTEAEWEYAARGGEHHVYAGGAVLDDLAWHWGDWGSTVDYENADLCQGEACTRPVCTKAQNGFGLCDMSGNVWEWTRDWHANYALSAAIDPTGPATGSSHVGRGGGWDDEAPDARASNRASAAPGYRSNGLGFRLVRSTP